MQLLKSLFASKPVIDNDTKAWLFDCVAWAVVQFGHQTFKQNTRLVLPNNQCYPGRVESIEGMARVIFDKTVEYCDMKRWPLTLVNPQQWQGHQVPRITYSGQLRSGEEQILLPDHLNTIQIGYNPSQVNQPQDMIATLVQQIASVLIRSTGSVPPGGQNMIPAAIDVLSCVMGFGVMFANTAYQFRGGCGSCYNPRANRQAILPENDMLYTLAIFCVLKQIPVSDVAFHLKRHLRSGFKSMHKEVINTFKHNQGNALQLIFEQG